jgi:hypothetical protein
MDRESSVLTIAQAAADLQITEPRVWRFHRDGRLAIMYMAGSPTLGRRGAKDGRIDREEWERFKRSLAVILNPEPAPEPTPAKWGRPAKQEGGEPSEPKTFADRYAAKMKRKMGR